MDHPCRGCAGLEAPTNGSQCVELFSPRRFDFSGLSSSSEAEVAVLRNVPVGAFLDGRLNVRIHERDILHASSKVEVLLYNAAPSSEAPEDDFVASDELILTRVVPGSAPALESETFDGATGFVDVVVRGFQGGSAGDPCVATLSAELVGKSGLENAGGRTIPILSRRLFDFSNLAASATEEVVCARAIDVSAFKHGVLVTRIHERTIGGTADLSVRVLSTWPSEEEPETDFFNGSPAAVTTFGNGNAPALLTSTLSTAFGPALRVVVRGNQPGGSPDTIMATLSVDLVLRE